MNPTDICTHLPQHMAELPDGTKAPVDMHGILSMASVGLLRRSVFLATDRLRDASRAGAGKNECARLGEDALAMIDAYSAAKVEIEDRHRFWLQGPTLELALELVGGAASCSRILRTESTPSTIKSLARPRRS